MKKLTILGSFLIAAAVLTSCGGNDPAADAKAYQDCMCGLNKVEAADLVAATKKCADQTAADITKYKDDEDGAKAYAAEILKLGKEDCPE